MTQQSRVLGWCFRYFKALDESNAAVHLATVKYSPITFGLAECINAEPADSYDLHHSEQVLAHSGTYELDTGR